MRAEVFVANVKEPNFFSWVHTMRDLEDYQAHFADDIARIEALTGRDLQHWT